MTSTTICFASLDAPARRWRPLSPRSWTCVGLLAIPLWATWPALALRALEIPPFECLSIAFFAGWVVLGRLESASRAPERALAGAASWVPAIACALGLCGSNAFHILATHYIPAAEANLIAYLWPIEIMGFGALLQLFRLQTRHAIGLTLGVAGAAALLARGGVTLSFTGVGLALLSGLSWAAYCLFRLLWQWPARQVLRRGCALSIALCALLHGLLEPTRVPSLAAVAAAAAVGIVPLALGNRAWDEGFRRGDARLLSVMAYATPLCSALLLVALGLESLTFSLAVGAVLIAAAGWLSSTQA